jgi:hypothetical protein
VGKKISREAQNKKKMPSRQLHLAPSWLLGNREINLRYVEGAAVNRQVVVLKIPAYLALELARRGKKMHLDIGPTVQSTNLATHKWLCSWMRIAAYPLLWLHEGIRAQLKEETQESGNPRKKFWKT